jgi:TRAP-type C4-dicarboxylate transport system permease small subunit
MMLKKYFEKFIKGFRLVETALLVFFLSLIFIIAVLQIFLKKVQGTEFLSPILKYAVLWAGMIAAGIATYEGKHIKIDIIGRFAKGRLKQAVLMVTSFFAGFVCAVLFIGFVFYLSQIEYISTVQPPFFNIPRWILLLILPISFFIISVRFMIQSVKRLINVILNRTPEEPSELPVDKGKEQK